MWIYPEENTVFNSHSEIRSHFNNVSFPSTMTDDDIEWVGVMPVEATPKPTYDIIHERLVGPSVVQEKGAWKQGWEVVTLSPAEVEENIAEKQKADSVELQRKTEVMWQAADKYTSSFISGVAIGILTIGVIQQKPKALAVSAWSSSVWAEYYRRKALITLESIDDHDFTSLGSIPYSVPELQAEIGL